MARQVLLVDDDAELRNLTQKYLERNGFDVVVAGDGWEAIREIVVNRPDIVIMDIEMPKLSGLNALDILRVSRLTEQLPIIVTSAHGDKDTIMRTVQLGADDFIVKPYAFSELSARIAVHLFQLDFKTLSQILKNLNKPAETGGAFWSGLDAARYQDWGAYSAVAGERELCVLLQRGTTLEQAAGLTEEQAQRKVMVLSKSRTVWKCVWPSAPSAAALKKAG